MTIDEKDIDQARELSKKFPNAKTEYFLCNVPYPDESYFGLPSHKGEYYWGIFTERQEGYKTAIEKFPYFYKEDLLALLGREDTSRDGLIEEILR